MHLITAMEIHRIHMINQGVSKGDGGITSASIYLSAIHGNGENTIASRPAVIVLHDGRPVLIPDYGKTFSHGKTHLGKPVRIPQNIFFIVIAHSRPGRNRQLYIAGSLSRKAKGLSICHIGRRHMILSPGLLQCHISLMGFMPVCPV